MNDSTVTLSLLIKIKNKPFQFENVEKRPVLMH